MGKYYAFNKTVEGHLHTVKGIPCEDYSASYSSEDGQFQIAVVADGHGDKACARSAEGSRKAVEITGECLMDFARGVMDGQTMEGYKSLGEELKAEKYGKRSLIPEEKNGKRSRILETLTNTIISRWYAFVNEDITRNPLTEEEMSQGGQYEEDYRAGNKLAHVYGTTLIGALMLPDYLILIQQGDGRCDVFYEDGSVEQPIPWDDKCHENITTSMCDEDVAEGIRSCVLDLKERKAIACYLGSDGVEDSYRNMEGTHMFYQNLTCELVQRGTEEFGAYLEEMLPGFSRTGSGDDVSVGGIVDLERIGDYVLLFQKEVERYNLSEELARYESRKISMSRKHEILSKRAKEAERHLEEEKKRLEEAKRQLEEGGMRSVSPVSRTAPAKEGTIFRQSGEAFRRWKKKKELLEEWEGKVEAAEEGFRKAREEFEEYDRGYQEVLAGIERVGREMENLSQNRIGYGDSCGNRGETLGGNTSEPCGENSGENTSAPRSETSGENTSDPHSENL